MPSKLQIIKDAYNYQLEHVTQPPAEWTAFLRAAARNYKLPFDEQLLVYAQRPDATAVLEIERWNELFGRWVNQGSTGIAVFDRTAARPRLKYYFDIADTHESLFSLSLPVPIWEMQPEYAPDVLETLRNSYGPPGDETEAETLEDALIAAASALVGDNLPDYAEQLNGLDVTFDPSLFRQAVLCSVAYMMLSRCGADTDPLDMSWIHQFNTPALVNLLGAATSDIAEMGLREIAAVVIPLQKNSFRTFDEAPGTVYNETIPAERTENQHEQHDLHAGGRLSGARSDTAAAAGGRTEPLGPGAAELPSGTQEAAAHAHDDPAHPLAALVGDAGNGGGAVRPAGTAYGRGQGRDGGTQSQQSNAVGGPGERGPAQRGGTGEAGAGLQLSLFASPEEQIARIEEAGAAKAAVFSISQQVIDEVLTAGGSEVNSPHRIVSYFKKDHDTAGNAAFLKGEYGNGGRGFIIGGNRVSIWFNESGIHIAVGDTALNADAATLVTWEQAAKRIRELLDMGRYMSQSELDKADGLVLSELTSKLYFLYRDGVGELPDEWKSGPSNYNQCVPIIAEQLNNPETLQQLIGRLNDELQAALSGTADLKWPSYFMRCAPDILRGLVDLQREPLVFTADESVSTAQASFITQDELDRVVRRGGTMDHGKYRIYAFFLHPHTAKEKTDFLKQAYGTGGEGRTGFDEWHDGKGITYSRDNNLKPYDKVLLTWPKVAKRIDELIADGSYMAADELAHIPEYEKDELARTVVSFYPMQPENLPRPFPYRTDFWDGIKIVRPLLDEPERVAEILAQMETILGNTDESDRNYEHMRKAYNDLSAYRDGTYSLFTPAAPAVPVKSAAPAPETIEAAASEMPMEYRYSMGSEVYLDDGKYEVFTASSDEVRLYNPSFPILNRVMSRDEFELLLAEYPANDYLLEPVEEAPEAPVEESAPTLAPETPRILYKKYLPLLLDEIRKGELYPYLRDRDTDVIDAEAEIGRELDMLAESFREDDPAFFEAYEHLTQFREWLAYDILDRTYQDYSLERRDSVARNEADNDCPEWAQLPPLPEQVREELHLRGFVVSEELIADGIEDYRARDGIGGAEAIAGFIETEYLSEDEPELAAEKLFEEISPSGERTDYYLFHSSGADTSAALSLDTLSLLTEKADSYVICANVCFLSEEELDKWRIVFRKLPRDWALLPGQVQAQIRAVKPEYEKQWLEQSARDVLYEGPFVIINWSESTRFSDNERLTFAEADAKFKAVELIERRERAERGETGGYFKTQGKVYYLDAPEDIEPSTYEFRYDICDYDELHSGLYNHIKSFWDYTETQMQESEREYLGYTQENIANVKRMLAILEPFQSKTAPAPQPQPGHEAWSEPATEDNAPEHPGEPSDDITAYLPGAATAPEAEDDFSPQSMIGHEIMFEGRRFRVDSINTFYDKASLLDLAMYESGMPIFREEPVGKIRWLIEHENDPPVQDPSLAPGQHVEKIGGTEFVVTTLGPTESRRPQHSGVYFPGEIETREVHVPLPEDFRRNFRITDDDLGHGGAKAKFRMNVDAIALLKALDTENRLATPAEQETLSRYVGWGGIAQAFDPENEQWAGEYQELQALLAPEEYTAARASTLNAHYTSPTVIKAIYKTIENMGFTQGNVLEPSCGIGNFFGLVPESMSASKMYGVELDPITGRIARQLYQSVNIAIEGFEATELPDSFFDLAIGNVPFGDYSVADRRYDKHHFHIHDYFFAKTLDKVRPGGVVAFITSKYTLDKKDPSIRKYIAQRAELLGAIRLPNTAFKANAGTEVTADIIFLQKRDRAIEVEPDWIHLGQTWDDIAVNSYFIAHPEMVLGEMTLESTQYGHDTTCRPYPDRDLADLLGEAVQNIHAEIADYERDDQQKTEGAIPADPSVRNFSYTMHNGSVYFREDSIMLPQELSATARSRVKGMIGIRDSARRLIELQTEDAPDSEIRREQVRLGVLYDMYTVKYGLLSDRANASVFRDDGSYPLLCSLEVLDKDGNLERKADMFTKRTIRPYAPITHVDTAAEALTVSIAEKARVDLAFMSELSGMDENALVKELEGVIFFDCGTSSADTYVTADEYLSGNVREKLKTAIEAQKAFPDGRYDSNVRALEAAQPKDLTASEISVRLGATWVPTDVVQDFIFELLEPSYWAQREVQVHYSQYTAEWNITGKSVDKNSIAARVTYGTDRVSAYHIVEQTLNLRTVRVFDTVYDAQEQKDKRVLNPEETAIAQGKQEIIKAKFLDWVWDDPDRRERLCGIYNSLYNSTRPREYDGSHIQFVGMNPEKQLDAHQRNGVARHLYGGNALLGHVVGAGKTFTMVAAAMEGKRLGLSNKALFIVPNNIVGQFASEFLQLYPSANVLMVTAKDFEKQNRRKFCARIATGEYDGIVMAHSQFEKLAMSVEWQQDFLQRQVDDLAEGIADMKWESGERVTVKAMERIRKSLQVKIQKLNEQDRKDDMLTFEELGVDLLFVDEADLFKNLMLVTKMRNVAGIGQTDAQKASDLFMKTRYLDAQTGKRGVVFATGTPVSNTMAEMYTMQRYLQYDALVERGLEHFDAWASTFGETVTAMELAPEGTGFRMKTRFSRFYNLPELMAMFRQFADIQTKDMLNLPTPTVHYRVIAAKPSERQREMVQALAERADLIRRRKVNPREDNMLLVTNDGRKLALDQRLINPLLPDVPGSKVNLCVENVFRIWEDTAEKRLMQLVFIDLSTPKDGIEFDVYHDIKEKLLKLGVPSDEIAFIHEAKNEAQKQALFGRVRTGAVRVLLGSTAKMGAGTNVQDLLVATHDLDCPWRPRDLEQRAGRLERRGNTNPEVEIYRYVTEHTFDAYLYQIIENKQKFISQVFTSKSPERAMQDVDEAVLNFAEVKAIASGDKRIMELCTLEADVSRLKLLKSSFMSERYALQDKALKHLPARIGRIEREMRGYEADAALAARTSPASAEHFAPMVVEGRTLTTPKDAGFAILEACKGVTSKEPVPLGTYRGFALELSWDMREKSYELHIVGQGRCEIGLGTDARGCITRIDNALADFPTELQCSRRDLEEAQQQLAAALAEKDKPFPQETELSEKSTRLGEQKAALQIDQSEPEFLEGEAPDEGDGTDGPQRRKDTRER